MSQYIIRFITSEDEVNIILESATIEDWNQTDFVQNLWDFTCVDKTGKSRCFALEVSKTLKELFALLQDKYGKVFPKFNAVVALLNRTPEGKIFAVAFNTDWSVYINTQMKCIINELEGGPKAKEQYEEVIDVFRDVLKHYHFITADPNKFHRIGEPIRNKRVCRFCGRSMPETTYVSDSHTISEALGNKNFITNDECDQCNSRFGQGDGIENDMLNMHAPLITILGVKGKKHIPEFTGKDFGLSYIANKKSGENPSIEIKLIAGESITEENDLQKSIKLESDKRVVPQNVYRVLCKYAIGMLPDKYLCDFGETIRWINGEFDIPMLPSVRFWLMNQRTVHPTMTVVIRYSDDKNYPYAYGEFTAVCFKYIFIIPLANKETTDFIDVENYNRWWKLLRYAHPFPWRTDNLSFTRSRKMTFKFNFHKYETGESK